MKKFHISHIAISIALSITVSALGAGSVFAQGGSGRPSTSTPTNTSKPAPRRPRSRSSNSSSSDIASDASADTPTLPPGDDSTASLDETLNWIGQKLATFSFWAGFFVGSYGINTDSHYLAVEEDSPGSPSYKIDGCVVTANRSFRDRNKGQREIEIVIPFADVDPNSFQIKTIGGNAGAHDVAFTAVRPTAKFRDSGGYNSSGSSVSVGFWKPEDAKSFGKAVRHAARLCGGKIPTSPF